MSSRNSRANFVFLLAEKIVNLLAVAAVNIVVLRSLGPDEFGYLGAATAVLAITLPLSLFGQVALVRFYAEKSASESQLLRVAVLFSVVGSLLGFIALVVSAHYIFRTGPSGGLLLILSLAMLARPFSAVDFWFQATKQNSTAALCRTASILASSIGRMVVALTTQSLWLLACIVVLENLIAGVLLTAAYLVRRRSSTHSVLLPSRSAPFSAILRVSLPLLAYSFMVILYMRIDQPMLLVLSDSREVGLYSAAANLSDAMSFLPTALLTAVLPGLVALNLTDRASFEGKSDSLFRLAAGLGYLVGMGGIALGPLIVGVLYGPDFEETGVLVQILFCGAPFLFLGVLRTVWILTEGLHFEALVSAVGAVLLNIGLNLFLIPHYGAVAAATTTVLAHIFNGILGNLFFRKTRGLFLRQMRALIPWRSLATVYAVLRWRRI
ncbi:flippase [Cryobacterium melibiosiphilum]